MATASSNYSFAVNAMVRGHHVYSNIWDASMSEVLPCEREIDNRRDTFAVRVSKPGTGTVGHLPRLISAACSVFLRRGGIITCTVTCSRRYSRDFTQGGLELPCLLTFTSKNQSDITKAHKLVSPALALVQQLTEQTTTSLPSQDEPSNKPSTVSDQIAPVVAELEVEETVPPPQKKNKKNFSLTDDDIKNIIMGEKLRQDYIYLGQQLIKKQFPNICGLQSILLQDKSKLMPSGNNTLQVVHCRTRDHCIAAATNFLKYDANEVAIYDSVFHTLDKETEEVLNFLFQSGAHEPLLKVKSCQKQQGEVIVDCSL
uniref:HIRAN domain-containing protein n=1 Tax=Amphimedon queenslandica TaxID=400682 RepID=A0A1X7V6W2_AMPQE